MKTASKGAIGPVKPLVMVEAPLEGQGLEAVIGGSLDAGCEVMVVGAGDGSVPSQLLEMTGVHRQPFLSDVRRRDAVRAVAAAAGRMGMTHLITLDAGSCCEKALAGIAAQTRAEPGVVICGVRRGDPAFREDRAGLGRRLANFLFRVQTGIRIADSTSGLRAYPLDVLACLKPLSRGACFDYEVLVRAAWAGADIREVGCSAAPRRNGVSATLAGRVAKWLVFMGLNVHLTMRSITPWRHRKLAGRDSPSEAQPVSLRHPWRSLKILVGQNISARRLGLAAALGVFLGTLPLIACHSIAILFTAGFFRLNKVAALSASQLCMPPIVPALCIEAGYYVRHGVVFDRNFYAHPRVRGAGSAGRMADRVPDPGTGPSGCRGQCRVPDGTHH